MKGWSATTDEGTADLTDDLPNGCRVELVTRLVSVGANSSKREEERRHPGEEQNPRVHANRHVACIN